MSIGPINPSSVNPVSGNVSDPAVPSSFREIGVPPLKAPAMRKGEPVKEQTIMDARGVRSVTLDEANAVVSLFLSTRGK